MQFSRNFGQIIGGRPHSAKFWLRPCITIFKINLTMTISDYLLNLHGWHNNLNSHWHIHQPSCEKGQSSAGLWQWDEIGYKVTESCCSKNAEVPNCRSNGWWHHSVENTRKDEWNYILQVIQMDSEIWKRKYFVIWPRNTWRSKRPPPKY